MSGGVRCNLSPEDQDRILAGFDDDLTREEEERVEALFHPHLFYSSVSRSKKACYCESCKASFEVTKATDSTLWREDHGSVAKCPRCGEAVEIICEGRIRTGECLEESKCVLVIRADQDGALRLYAGVAKRGYERQDYFDDWNNILHREFQPFMSFLVYRRYYLAPWGRQCWKQGYWNYFGERGHYGEWEPKSTIVQAFTPGHNGYWCAYVFDGQYNVIGAENIRNSYAKYSQAFEWIYGQGEPNDGQRVYGLEQYLAAYIEYPQLEFAVKMGEEDAVSDLVLRGVKNHRVINWKAKNPAGFYRMDKQQFKKFTAAGGKTKDLILAKELALPVEDVLMAKRAVSSGSVRELAVAAGKANISISQAVRYLSKQRGSTTAAMREWKDYLDMAEKLNYDLTNREVSTPKQLTVVHDRAAELLQTETDRTLQKKYIKSRRTALRKKYEMEYAGMCVRVPKSSAEIVTEGKVLEHCVGGYAKRHLEGKTVILFLRRADEPDQPLVTIEMNSDGKTIRQIHGWHNECVRVNGVFPKNPREIYAEFLDMWLEWLAAGSPRTSTGQPILSVMIRQEVSA